MTQRTIEVATGRIQEADLIHLAKKTGEIWSAGLPATHPGAGEGTKLKALRALSQEPQAKWISRMEELLVERQLAGGGPGLALFVGDDFAEVYVAGITSGRIAHGESCHLLPLLREAQTRQEFLILGISKKELKLLRYAHGVCTEVALPEGMPTNLEEFHAHESRERNAENHASVSTAVGGKSGVRFGTKAERESDGEHLEHFFLVVDQELSKVAGGSKVLLWGVLEEVALFRRTAKKLSLMDGQIASGIRDVELGEIALLAGAFAPKEQAIQEKAALDRIREWRDRSRVEGDLARILVAAANGQVDELCLKDQGATKGLVGEWDVLANQAAVETLRHKGHVRVVAASDMNGLGDAVAVLRF